MKTRIATVISVVGVLAAGTAAAMVNTQIFESQPTVSDESSAMLAPQPTTVGLSLEPQSTSTIADSTGAGSLTEFVVGEAGVVTVDVIDGQLRIVSASAFDGWTIVDQEEDLDENSVEVDFASGSLMVEFDADYVGGNIIPDIDSERIVPAPSNGVTGTTAPSATTTGGSPTYRDDDEYDDDDHDDEYDDDDHDDDHDDDEYEDHDEDDDDD